MSLVIDLTPKRYNFGRQRPRQDISIFEHYGGAGDVGLTICDWFRWAKPLAKHHGFHYCRGERAPKRAVITPLLAHRHTPYVVLVETPPKTHLTQSGRARFPAFDFAVLGIRSHAYQAPLFKGIRCALRPRLAHLCVTNIKLFLAITHAMTASDAERVTRSAAVAIRASTRS